MTDKQINFEAIGHCTHLGARISQFIEHRTELYKKLRNLGDSGMIPYNSAMNNKDINLEGVNRAAELLKKINDTNQSIINAAKAYNSWADKAGYEHYIISGGAGYNTGFSVDFTAGVFNVTNGQVFINDAYIKGTIVASNELKMSETARIKPEFEITTEQKLAELEAKINSLSACQSSLTHQLNGL